MIRAELPLPRAFRTLTAAVEQQGASASEAVTFALTWLAAAKMTASGNAPGSVTLEDLGSDACWKELENVGLPVLGAKRWHALDVTSVASLRPKATLVVKELLSELGQQPWDVLPVLISELDKGGNKGGEAIVRTGLIELMLDMLGEVSGDLWIPFDPLGVLTVSALRRGWRVKTAQMSGPHESPLPLLLAIEYGRPNVPQVDGDIARDREGRPLTRATHVLACPPFGVAVLDTRLTQWDSSGGEALTAYARSETWAVHELINRASEKAVFLVPPGLLFTRGQEQRLREHLLHRGGEQNELQSVVALPGGAWTNTSVGAALLVMTPGHGNDDVLMVDLGSSRRSTTSFDDLLAEHREVALGVEEDSVRARRVSRDLIMATETSLAPSRYLRKTVEVGPNAVALEELCVLLRAPALAKDEKAMEVSELGIPELGQYTPVMDGLTKRARVKARRDLPTLEVGDLVLSIKGTIGKVGLAGDLETGKVVVSQSCVGIRLISDMRRVTPAYLLMYLRSAAGQAQLESLQAGAAVQHISPQTLLSSFLVPVPDAQEIEAVERDYQLLCQLERQAADIQKRMGEISIARWSA